ncbi:hypothetical protein Talka_00079 [Tepidimonas alkaliphilus]|uniref:DUF4124 domain-containing protein n=1 Tax=Tepidimonas alkaliphilus TaxID=2588942 RepID=A0A554WCV9_9BURK|nr:hypothetical protein [Tepidimonas alkaliphilus]TSE21411.1 hypothetical protein Talka_00079 [Tepidimonas alkaliphilus]
MGGAVLAAALVAAVPALAQGGKIWRCGNEYTNNPGADPAARGCREVLGGNLTIVEGTRPAPPPGAAAAAGSSAGAGSGAANGAARTPAERVTPDQQRQRDLEARRILEQELRRAQERLEQARAEWAQAQAARPAGTRGEAASGSARADELRARVERAEADVAALRRELARLPAADAR